MSAPPPPREEETIYPIMLDIRGVRCLVVGGGGVALRKVNGLVEQGARVTVVAQEPVSWLAKLADAGEIELLSRPYRDGEAGDYGLVFAATNDPAVNRQVFNDARDANVWATVADDPELSAFHTPARVQRGAMQLAIASTGEAPFVVRRLRQLLERRFGPEWAEWIEAASHFRDAVRGDERLSRAEREARYDAFFNATIDPDHLTARVPTAPEEHALLAIRPADRAKSATSPAPPTPKPPARAVEASRTRGEESGDRLGLVSLVGAGPGDAGLVSVRGYQRLHRADTVVYDRLAATAIPLDLNPHVELRSVGKKAKHHPMPQEEINALLVRLARQGKRVVRLKGGDPFVFGRGGEEAEALAEAGVPFEVVPSVTAGIAAPAYAGIPVTHRREAVRVTIITAHEAIKSDGPQVRWDLLAQDPHATLLGYMGVSALPKVVERLLAAGMDPTTPAAMIEYGTTSAQKVVRASVAELPGAVEGAGLKPPGLFVIGPTVAHAERLDWFGSRPLVGLRLVMVAPGGPLAEALEQAGAEVLPVPLPVSPAARIVMGTLPLSACLLKDVEELEALDEERDGPGWDADVVGLCLDEETATRARELGWQHVEVLAGGPASAEIVQAVVERWAPRDLRAENREQRTENGDRRSENWAEKEE